MTISAKVIADSISPENIRITTMQIRYTVKFIQANSMTHRVFSTELPLGSCHTRREG